MKIPCFRFTLHLVEYPASLGTLTLRWSQRPLADTGAWSEARLISIGDISRSCTNQDGNYELSELDLELSDDDHRIRTLLETAGTQYFYGRQGELEILSEAGRAASLTWRSIFRGVVTDVQTPAKYRASAKLKDLIGSQFSGFDLDKKIGVPVGDEHTNLPDASRKKIYQIVVGEHSDSGAVDSNGDSAEKGMLPVLDTGDYNISGAVDPPPPTTSAPPVITNSGVVGSSGEHTYYYAASLITPYGESGLSNAVTISGAAGRDASNYNWVSGTYDNGGSSPFNKVRIWRSESLTVFTEYLDEADYFLPEGSFGYADGAKLVTVVAGVPSVSGDETDNPKTGPILSAGNAPNGVGNANNDDDTWGRLLVGLGCVQVDGIYWSDLAANTEPKRILADTGLDGEQYLTADSTAWPHADRFLELTNPTTGETIRASYIYVRGPRLVAHRQGGVTIAVNGCGMEDVGDGTGVLVDQAFRAGQLFTNEHILKDAGTGYRNGAYGPLEQFSNGDAQLATSAWTAAQAVTIARIGGLGYLAAWCISEPITVREWVQRFCLSFDCRLTINQHGQIMPVVIDDLADPSVGRAYREFEEDAQLIEQPLAQDEVENHIVYSYDSDTDKGAYRVVEAFVEDAPSIAAHVPGGVVGTPDPRGVHPPPTQELFCVRDPATANDSRARRLTRNKKAPRYPAFFVPDFRALEDDIGAQVRFTHRDGKGASGDSLTPLVVLKHVVKASYGQMGVELTGIDVQRIAADGGAEMTGVGFLMTDTGTEMR